MVVGIKAGMGEGGERCFLEWGVRADSLICTFHPRSICLWEQSPVAAVCTHFTSLEACLHSAGWNKVGGFCLCGGPFVELGGCWERERKALQSGLGNCRGQRGKGASLFWAVGKEERSSCSVLVGQWSGVLARCFAIWVLVLVFTGILVLGFTGIRPCMEVPATELL